MELIPCFGHSKELQDKFLDRIKGKGDLSEAEQKEIGRQLANDHHKQLDAELGKFKTGIGLKHEPLKVADNSQKTKEINDKYDNLISQLKPKENAIPERSAEATNVAEAPQDSGKMGTRISGAEEPPIPQGKEKGEDTGEGEGVSGLAQRVREKRASDLGLNAAEEGKGWSLQESVERGKKLRSEGVDPEDVISNFNKDHRLNGDDMAVVRDRADELARETEAARKSGDKEAFEKAKDKEDDFLKRSKPMQTEWHKIGIPQTGETDVTTGDMHTVRKVIESSNGGKPLTPKQEEEATKLTDKIKKTKAEADNSEKNLIAETDKELGSKEKAKPTRERLSKQLSDIAKRLRTSAEFDDFLRGAQGDIQKMGVDLPRLKEIAASILEDAAKAVKAGENAIDFIREAVGKLKEDVDKDKLIEGLTKIGEKQGLFDVKETSDEAFERKQKQGLVRSKMKRPLTEQEQIEADEKELTELSAKFVNKVGNKFTKDEAVSIWDYAKKNYLDKGVSYEDMIRSVKNDLGLSWEQVSNAISTPKTKPISTEMWGKQRELRLSQNETKRWVDMQNQSWEGKAFKKITGGFRAELLFGHGGVFVGTHAGSTLVDPATVGHTVNAFFNGYKLAYGSDAYFEQAMRAHESDPNYPLAQKSGLKNSMRNFSHEEYMHYSTWLGKKLGMAGERGFGAIKILRQKLWNYEWNKLSPEEKTEASAKRISWLINNATGATNLKLPNWVNEVSLSGGMEAARWAKYTKNPIAAGWFALKSLFQPDTTPIDQKVFAKVWASRVGRQLGTYATLLFVNNAIQKIASPSNPVNFTDPTKPDFLQMKFGDISVDASSGMLSEADFIYKLGHEPFATKEDLKGRSEKRDVAYKVLNRGLGKLSPAYATGVELFLKHDYSGNTLPWSDAKPDTKFQHKLTYPEYFSEKTPLPIAEGLRSYYEGMYEQGIKPDQINNITKGILSGAASGTTGFRINEYRDKKQIKESTETPVSIYKK